MNTSTIKTLLAIPCFFWLTLSKGQSHFIRTSNLSTTQEAANINAWYNLQDEKLSVMMVEIYKKEGTSFGTCTAFAINTLNQNDRYVYFVTAAHCVSKDCIYDGTGNTLSVNAKLSFRYEVFGEADAATNNYPSTELLELEVPFYDPEHDILLLRILKDDLRTKLSEWDGHLISENFLYLSGWTLTDYLDRSPAFIAHERSDVKKIFNLGKGRLRSHTVVPKNLLLATRFTRVRCPYPEARTEPSSGVSGCPAFVEKLDQGLAWGVFSSEHDQIVSPSSSSFVYGEMSMLSNSWADKTIDDNNYYSGYLGDIDVSSGSKVVHQLQHYLDPNETWVSYIPGSYMGTMSSTGSDDLKLTLSSGEVVRDTVKIYGDFLYFLNKEKVHKGTQLAYEKTGIKLNKGGGYIKMWIAGYPDKYYWISYYYPLITEFYDFRAQTSVWDLEYLNTGKSIKTLYHNYVKEQSGGGLSDWTVSDYPYVNLCLEISPRSKTEMVALALPGMGSPKNALEVFKPDEYESLFTISEYPESRGKNSTQLYIESVKILDKDNQPLFWTEHIFDNDEGSIISGDNDGYVNFRYEMVEFRRGEKVTFEIYVKGTERNYWDADNLSIWIDGVNDDAPDFQFTDLEKITEEVEIAESVSMSNGQLRLSFNYKIPETTDLSGQSIKTMMRIVFGTNEGTNEVSGSGEYDCGETEDYMVHLLMQEDKAIKLCQKVVPSMSESEVSTYEGLIETPSRQPRNSEAAFSLSRSLGWIVDVGIPWWYGRDTGGGGGGGAVAMKTTRPSVSRMAAHTATTATDTDEIEADELFFLPEGYIGNVSFSDGVDPANATKEDMEDAYLLNVYGEETDYQPLNLEDALGIIDDNAVTIIGHGDNADILSAVKAEAEDQGLEDYVILKGSLSYAEVVSQEPEYFEKLSDDLTYEDYMVYMPVITEDKTTADMDGFINAGANVIFAFEGPYDDAALQKMAHAETNGYAIYLNSDYPVYEEGNRDSDTGEKYRYDKENYQGNWDWLSELEYNGTQIIPEIIGTQNPAGLKVYLSRVQ